MPSLSKHAGNQQNKYLCMELDQKFRNTCIKLHDVRADGHFVFYDFFFGKRALLALIARALGFKTVTDEL